MLRATMLFQQISGANRVAGWSESWYVDQALSEAQRNWANICTNRAGLLGGTCSIVGQRFQTVGGRSATTSQVYPGQARILVDAPQMAALCTVNGDGVANTKKYTLRGIIDTEVVQGELSLGQDSQAAFQNFALQLRARGFRFRARDLTQPRVAILNIGADGTFILQADLVFAVGDTLTMMRVRDTAGRAISGNFFVRTRVDARNGQLANWPGNLVVERGNVRRLNYVYPLLEAGTNLVLKSVVRKVGRPFNLYAGRAVRAR